MKNNKVEGFHQTWQGSRGTPKLAMVQQAEGHDLAVTENQAGLTDISLARLTEVREFDRIIQLSNFLLGVQIHTQDIIQI